MPGNSPVSPRADPRRSTCLRPKRSRAQGAHTQIVSPSAHHFSFVGSSLLARGGSGDLLTGILGALLAKKYSTSRPPLPWPFFGMAGPPRCSPVKTGRKRSTRPTCSISYPLPFEMTSDQPSLLVLAAGMGSATADSSNSTLSARAAKP